jgi:hypothetical protein
MKRESDISTPEGMLAFALKVCDEGESARRGRRRKASEDAARSARIAAEVAAERKAKK